LSATIGGMFVRLTLITLLIAGCKSEPGPQLHEGTLLARINGVPVYQKEFRSTLSHAEKVFSQKHGQISEDEKAKLRDRILAKMIDDELLVQHASSLGLEVSKAEVSGKLEKLKQSGGGDEAYLLFLKQAGLEPERVRANIRRNLMLQRLAERFRKAEEVKEQALSEYYQAHLDDFRGTGTVELAHILLKGDSGADQARKVRQKILKGLAFEQAAQRYSQDPATRENGGHLGTLKTGEMLPDLESAAFGLEPGSLSTPVRSPAGFHLLKVIGNRPGELIPLSQVETQVKELIIDSRVELKLKELLSRLRKTAKIVQNQPPRPD